MESIAGLEKQFKSAYSKRYGKIVKEFRTLGNGYYIINGIEFSEVEVLLMLQTLEEELAEKSRGLVIRLIEFFGGRARR